MISSSLSIWSAVLACILVGVAVITDLRARRIPNSLTFTAFGVAIVIRTIAQGWAGAALAVSGAAVAPLLLLALHAGRGLGMGDLKLSAAVGAFVGPVLAVAAMIVSAVAGGGLAAALMARRALADLIATLAISFPRFKTKTRGHTAEGNLLPEKQAVTAMPYGVALAIGTLVTLFVCWLTGDETWFFDFIK